MSEALSPIKTPKIGFVSLGCPRDALYILMQA